MSSTFSGTTQLQTSPTMLSRDQLFHLFSRFSTLTSHPDVKKRIADAVRDKQEAVAATTAIQEEIFSEMGVDPRFGLSCLGKVNSFYENDQELMVQFYKFVSKEEMVCDEAELEPDAFAEKLHNQQTLYEKQLEMLKHMRKFNLDHQSVILKKLHQQLESTEFNSMASILTSEEIQEIVQGRVSPLFSPKAS